MPTFKQRIKEIFAPTFTYCVTFNCLHCGDLIFTMLIKAQNPDKAIQKAYDFLNMQGICIYERCYIDAELVT